MEPSKWERAKAGAVMGGAVGLAIGLVFGGLSVLRNGPGSRGYVNTLAQTMISTTGAFAFFMAIGSVVRSDSKSVEDSAWARVGQFKTPPIVILQKYQQGQTQDKRKDE